MTRNNPMRPTPTNPSPEPDRMNQVAELPTEAQPQAWAEALGLLSENGLPAPPALSIWPSEVTRFDDSSFGNWIPKHRLYDLMDVLKDAWEGAPRAAWSPGSTGTAFAPGDFIWSFAANPC